DEDGTQVVQCNIRDITERKRSEEALRASESRLARELASTRQLQSVSTLLTEGGDLQALYQSIVDAAAAIMHTDKASMQVVDESRDALRLLAFRGFAPEFGQIFELSYADDRTS